ncbi:hypothetical protein [Microbacterium maritypicum]|uniref:hypothetical protein n=1 Tax=Microbacterium maritypicum TaxID=33918 RepID=UPI0037F6BD65
MILVPPREDSGALGAYARCGRGGTAAATLAAAALDSAALDSAMAAPFAVDSASNGLAVHDLTQKS